MSESIDHGGRFLTPSLSDTPSTSGRLGTSNGINHMWDPYWSKSTYGDLSSSSGGSDNSKESPDWPFGDWIQTPKQTTQMNSISTPIPVESSNNHHSARDEFSRSNNRSAYSFPGDGKLMDMCNSYGSLFNGLARSPVNNIDNPDNNNFFGQLPPSKRGTRVMRAESSLANGSSPRLSIRDTGSYESSPSRISGGSPTSGRGCHDRSPPSPANSDSGIGMSSLPTDSSFMTSLMSQLNLNPAGSVCRPSQPTPPSQSAQVPIQLNCAPTKPPRMASTSMFSMTPNPLLLSPFPPPISRSPSHQDPYMFHSIGDKRWTQPKLGNNRDHLEKALELQRTAASFCEAPIKWSGVLNLTEPKNPVYSTKVFLGGTPYDLTDEELIQFFSQFGRVEVEWPKENSKTKQKKKGYNYMIFESEKCVKALLSHCELRRDKHYIRLPSRRMPDKDVQVIPWILSNSNFTKDSNFRVEFDKTVFVGNLHGMMTAQGLAHIMDDLFDNVVYAGIDVDRFRYPIGSARVTFSDHKSYSRAVEAAFIDVELGRVSKRLQVDPYMVPNSCSLCQQQQAPLLCRTCARYFCEQCWHFLHSNESMKNHRTLARKRRVK
ncbi:polyadenylation element binding protein orb [Brevipalpus obovatus]|uniref:polyadenylation element binding protein orb n=1 Tax=Brevipalpus obovatus TaxID=246614 RepID=UPI003D9DC257